MREKDIPGHCYKPSPLVSVAGEPGLALSPLLAHKPGGLHLLSSSLVEHMPNSGQVMSALPQSQM